MLTIALYIWGVAALVWLFLTAGACFTSVDYKAKDVFILAATLAAIIGSTLVVVMVATIRFLLSLS